MNGNDLLFHPDEPVRGVQMKLSNEGGIGTIQLERPVQWMRFSKAELIKFIEALANLANRLPD